METSIPEIIWIQIIIVYLLLALMIFIIAYIESKTKVKDIYYVKQKKLFGYTVILFIFLLLFFGFVRREGISLWSIEMILLVTIIKLLLAFLISEEADRLGRNKLLWGILAFLEFHLVLIALGIEPKLLKINGETKKVVQNLNIQTLEKEKSINQALNSGIIDYSTKNEKLLELRKNYSLQLENIILRANAEEFNSKLNLAFKNGVITEEEFLSKKIKHEEGQI